MEERQYARDAVMLLQQARRAGLRNFQRDDSDIVRIATDIALDLQKEKFPDWYTLLENDLEAASSKQTPEKRKSQSEQQDDNVEEEISELSNSSDEKSTPTTPTERMRRKLLSVRLLMESTPAHSEIPPSPIESQTLRSSGIITAKSPPPNLELPLITARFRRSFAFSAMNRSKERRSKLPSTAIGLRSEKYSSPTTQKNRRGMEKKMRRKKCFGDVLNFEMENSNISSEYWEIPFDPFRESILRYHKIFKIEKSESENEQDLSLTKIGNPTATVLALCALKKLEIQKPASNEIIRHLDGISLFLNILDTDNRRCRRNGIQQLVSILSEDDKVVVSLACDVLSLMAKHSNVRVVANKMNIVKKLMSVFKACVKKALQGENLELFRSVCDALWSCCLSARDKDIKIISESLDVISRMMETLDEELVVPLLGIIEECASVEYFRGELEKENFIEKVISIMESKRTKVLSVKILFKCSSDETSQKTLLKPNNIQEIMELFKQNCQGRNDELLTLLLGIIWRCSLNREFRKKFETHGVFPLLSNILKSDKSIQVKSAALGVLSELLWDEADTDSIGSSEMINLLIDFMSVTEPAILVNSARSLGVCARNNSWRKTILQLDGLRLLWSLLKSSDEEVMSSGAVALASVCAYPEESANAVRSIVGGIELLMTLLACMDLTKCKVLICLCEAAVSIAKDAENRSILIDYDLIPVLLRLSESENKILRYYVTCLISRCCESPKERSVFSRCIPYLIEGLGHEYGEHVHCASICALNKLSRDFENCVFLRESSTTKILMNLLASSNERIQDAAAECLSNVRKSMMSVG
ncbi:Armadillo repeat-containing 4 [Paramuricea clavata]|uniref:Armadillo repeat-containing 4 n=1 Tax=Paramuricea clavata TaxID=317549 RepID=A0A6S7FLW3_PARCT|nr:Armadillo repeat-containing 4 [Paramuricea clavata]